MIRFVPEFRSILLLDTQYASPCSDGILRTDALKPANSGKFFQTRRTALGRLTRTGIKNVPAVGSAATLGQSSAQTRNCPDAAP